jgi:hypothetical protein
MPKSVSSLRSQANPMIPSGPPFPTALRTMTLCRIRLEYVLATSCFYLINLTLHGCLRPKTLHALCCRTRETLQLQLHSTTKLQASETRYLFTQYAAGGLFRWVKNGFCSDKTFVVKAMKKQMKQKEAARERCWKDGVGLFSKLSKLAT